MTDFTALSGAALVTGASGGLGGAIARLLVDRGSDVAVTYHHNEQAAADVVAYALENGQRALSWQLTQEDATATERVVDEVAHNFGGIHSVIHASGPLVRQVHLSQVEPPEFRRSLDQEVNSFFNLVQPAIPRLRETRGSVVAVTTSATRRFPVRDGLSAGPKGAVEALVRAFASEEGRFGVRYNCVGPGMMSDGMAQRLIASGDLHEAALEQALRNIPMRQYGTAADVAEAVCFLASPRARYITGVMLDVDGGFHL